MIANVFLLLPEINVFRAGSTKTCSRRCRTHAPGCADTPPDRRASLRHDQSMDGSDALSHQDDPAREYRDELARTRLQHETRDTNTRNHPANEGNAGLRIAIAPRHNLALFTRRTPIGAIREWPLTGRIFQRRLRGSHPKHSGPTLECPAYSSLR